MTVTKAECLRKQRRLQAKRYYDKIYKVYKTPKISRPLSIWQRPSKSQRHGVPCHLCGVPQRLVFGQTCTKSSFYGVPDPPTRGPGDPRGPHLLGHCLG
jgi:hypothetical protein